MESKKSNEPKSRSLFLTILVAVVVVLVIGSIAGYAIYRQEIAPFETVVLRIDEKEIKMRYNQTISNKNNNQIIITFAEVEKNIGKGSYEKLLEPYKQKIFLKDFCL